MKSNDCFMTSINGRNTVGGGETTVNRFPLILTYNTMILSLFQC